MLLEEIQRTLANIKRGDYPENNDLLYLIDMIVDYLEALEKERGRR